MGEQSGSDVVQGRITCLSECPGRCYPESPHGVAAGCEELHHESFVRVAIGELRDSLYLRSSYTSVPAVP